MDYEKSYKDALERARQVHTTNVDENKKSTEYIFPELKESEDERIRKEFCEDIWNYIPYKKAHKYIAWLEKQGEQKPDDKIEPTDYNSIDPHFGKPIDKVESKFKVGDWVVNNNSGVVYQVTEIRDDEYCLWPLYAEIMGYLRIIDVDTDYHLWTIQDAKDGDVLVHNGCTFIFMGIKDGIVQAIEENILETVSFGEPDKDNDYCPATKEQRDLLFAKMKEAGYMWDAEKKETKKFIKFKEGDWIINNDVYGDVPVKIKEIGNYLYLCERQDGVIIELNKDAVLKEYKHWDISDAKDGNVLYYKSDNGIEYIVMNKGINIYNNVDSYFRYTSIDGFAIDVPSVLSAENDSIIPATKEQRDTLMKAMAEAGYEWDAEKKESKLLVTNGGDFESENCEQKPVWSEEDEERLQSCLNILQAKGIVGVTETVNTKWLKSLKDRYTWKPSDKQLDALHDAAVYVDKSMFPYPKGILMKLYKQLKKLKEE